MSRQPTVSDVADAAGVSRQTVSNVLNAPGVVREATRERVLRVIQELGYRPHAAARQLRTRKSSTLGVRLDPVLNGISGAVLDRFLHALTERATARGLSILLFTATDPLDEIEQFRRLLDGAAVDAFVLTSTFYDDPRTAWLLSHNAPFVTFGRPWGASNMNDPRHRWVDVDGRTGVAEATKALLDRGASRIAYLGWPPHSGAGDERRLGWLQTMESAGVGRTGAIDALELVCEDDVHLASESVRRLLASGTSFDGLVCASDSLALGALMVLGSSVPIVGFDNTPVAEAVSLSSIEQPLEDVATAALDLLGNGDVVHHAGEPGTSGDPYHRLLQPRTVWREPQGARA